MTIEEFNKTRWGGNMFCTYNSEKHFVMSVDFIEALVGLTNERADIPQDEWVWVRCENIDLINNAME